MRRCAVVLLALLALPASAAAAPVLVYGHGGRVIARNDPFLNGPALTPAPAMAPARAAAAARPLGPVSHTRRRRRPRPPERTVRSELTRLWHAHQLSGRAYHHFNAVFNAALAAERRLGGARRSELTAVTTTLHDIAASRGFVPSRLPALFLTLDRNRQWWTSGPLLSSGQRVEFAGSQLVWEYYPGQGIQLQVLGTFGKANGLYESGPSGYGALAQLLGEMVKLAVHRGGGLAWEYYFTFDGGSPPWTSAMAQATGLQALAHAFQATGNGWFLTIGARALPLFSAAPPDGVLVPTPRGARYLQYSFAPGVSILNAFLQSLIGLDTYARVSGNRTAARLFAAGNAEAMAEVPAFDTGAWSLYQPGIEDDLSYHELVTGFLAQLCSMTAIPVYCTTARHFQADLQTAPALAQLTTTGRAGTATTLSFRLSKYSHVGVIVSSGGVVRFETSADFTYGTSAFTIPALPAGTYAVRLAATDLAGNFGAIDGTLQIAR